jgi:uncharacterized protein
MAGPGVGRRAGFGAVHDRVAHQVIESNHASSRRSRILLAECRLGLDSRTILPSTAFFGGSLQLIDDRCENGQTPLRASVKTCCLTIAMPEGPRTMRSVLLVCFLVFTSAVAAQAQPASGPVVVAQGEAVVTRVPDQAWLTMGSETRDVRAERARALSAEGMRALQDALKGIGLTDEAIRTTGYSLIPEIDWKGGKSVARGYVVRNQIEVRIDDLDLVPAAIDVATTARSTSLSITGPRFTLKDEASAQAEALRLAVTSALGRARAMATGAGRTLGAITRIEEHNLGGSAPEPMMRTAMADVVSTPISPGELEIRAMVTLTVELR